MPSKSFRPWLPDHPTLLPTDVRLWLPEDHLVWFVLELVQRLDISGIEERIRAKDPRGTPPYDPRMMTALLVYAYAVGVFSSRRIERATYEDVAFRILTGDQQPAANRKQEDLASEGNCDREVRVHESNVVAARAFVPRATTSFFARGRPVSGAHAR